MTLPNSLSSAIDAIASSFRLKDLILFSQEVTEKYRQGASLSRAEHLLSYLIARMPATFAVQKKIFSELTFHINSKEIETLLDVGAGPGTALWASEEALPYLSHVTLLEREKKFIAIAQQLLGARETSLPFSCEWKCQNILEDLPIFPFDLVLASYVLGEIPEEKRPFLIEELWKKTRRCLVVIEPGTPEGFLRVKKTRDQLLLHGASIFAPCPHALECPLVGGQAWCHFSVRLSRSALHRRIKRAELSFEDEKFSYMIFSKTPTPHRFSRVLHHPRKQSGRLGIVLCTERGIESKTIFKKEKEKYDLAKKLEWGDKLIF